MQLTLQSVLTPQLWWCAEKNCGAVGEARYFLNSESGHACPTCTSGDVFEDELYEGSYCGAALPNEFLTPEDNLESTPCPTCADWKACVLKKKNPRIATYPPH